MTPRDTAEDLADSNDAMTDDAEQGTQGKWKEVFLYGYVYHESDSVLRLYHGLGIPQFYSIPRKDVLELTSASCPQNPSLIKLRLSSTTPITYVSHRSVSLPAGSLAEVVARGGSTVENCPAYCLCNGKCTCAAIDHWTNLGTESAKKLGVVAIKHPDNS
jgi:hypothetical protein